MRAIGKSAAEGAKVPYTVAVSPEFEQVGGLYVTSTGPEKSSPVSYDEVLSTHVWQLSARLTKCGQGPFTESASEELQFHQEAIQRLQLYKPKFPVVFFIRLMYLFTLFMLVVLVMWMW